MADMGEWSQGIWVWKLAWRRPLFVWEEDLFQSLLDLLSDCIVTEDSLDGWSWLNQQTSSYSVKYAYHLLTSVDGREADETYKFLWDKSIPLKVGAFCWRAIFKRGIGTVSGESVVCFMDVFVQLVWV